MAFVKSSPWRDSSDSILIVALQKALKIYLFNLLTIMENVLRKMLQCIASINNFVFNKGISLFQSAAVSTNKRKFIKISANKRHGLFSP
jgi:hypothetical protein